MTKFIKLTRPDGSPVYVNADHISEVTTTSDIQPDETYRGITSIILIGDAGQTAREVTESLDKVMELINLAS